MSINRGDMNDGALPDTSRLLARGAADDVRARRRYAAAVADLHLAEVERLDDRFRTALRHAIEELCALVESDLRQFAARVLVKRGRPEPALALTREPAIVYQTLLEAGLIGDPAFVRAMLGRTGIALLAERLPTVAATPERPSLLARLVDHRDGMVATTAAALLAADARRRDSIDGPAPRNDIAAEQQHQLVWWSAAALCRAFAKAADDRLALDRAFSEAAERALSVHDEGQRAEAAASRLVAMLAPSPTERAELLGEALTDRRPGLFVALLAQALGLDHDTVRDLVLDHEPHRLWLALRAAALDRPTIARIGLALHGAVHYDEVELFADQLDAIMAVTPEAAAAALASLHRHPDLRAADEAIERGWP